MAEHRRVPRKLSLLFIVYLFYFVHGQAPPQQDNAIHNFRHADDRDDGLDSKPRLNPVVKQAGDEFAVPHRENVEPFKMVKPLDNMNPKLAGPALHLQDGIQRQDLGAIANRVQGAAETLRKAMPVKAENKHKPANELRQIKISESAECKDDVQKNCDSKLSNNFAILDCLQNESKDPVSSVCQNYLWQYKKNLTLDMRFDSAAMDMCKQTLDTTLPECASRPRGTGERISCLIEHKENVTNDGCKKFLTKMASIVFSDYRLINRFAEACEADITKLQCGRLPGSHAGPSSHSQGYTLECLSEHVKSLTKECKHQILRIAELQSDDFHQNRALYYACRDDRDHLCPKVKAGNGHVYKCLLKKKFDKMMSSECREKLVVNQRLMAEDVKVNRGLFDACRTDMRAHHCMRDKEVQEGRVFRMSRVVMCLEGVRKEDEVDLKPECEEELMAARRMVMEDYRISPELVDKCDLELKEECLNKGQQGKTLHCLMDLAKAHKVSSGCQRELEKLLREADVAEDIGVDPYLLEACQIVIDAHCKGHNAKNTMACLMEKVNTEQMEDMCEERLMEVQYFVARDFKLSSHNLYKHCKSDAHEQCHAPKNWFKEDDDTNPDQGPTVLACLYRKMKAKELTRACAFEVRFVMRQRAVNVALEPRIEEPCMQDLGMFCSDNTKRGQEMQCLQDNYDDLSDDCRDAVAEFTEDEDKDINLDKILMKACTPMIEDFCKANQDAEPEDIMACLIKHKRHPDMDPKCAAGIEHHQLTNLKDFRFSFSFKEACKASVQANCKSNIRQKSDVIKCLSEMVRNDTLLDQKQRVDVKCRQQLRFEELQRSESINLDPELKANCQYDVQQFCANVSPGGSAVLECLKKHKKELDRKCRDVLFKRQEQGALDARTDFLLTSTCKEMIKTYCSDVQPGELFQCLRKHKDQEDFSDSCKRVVLKRMRLRSQDVRLNPHLQKACKLDIHKFCEAELSEKQKHQGEDSFEGTVIRCLRIKFTQKRLSQSCEEHIAVKIKESAKDFKQDVGLARHCAKEIESQCAEAAASDYPDNGQVEECLKKSLASGKIDNPKCMTEIVRVLSENMADVHVDPLLYRACANDIKHYCVDVPRGRGRHMSCLLSALQDKSVHLQPECFKMMTDRVQMWEFAAKVAPPESMGELMNSMATSPSRNYFFGILFAVIGCIFIGGLFCGRVTKRVSAATKNK